MDTIYKRKGARVPFEIAEVETDYHDGYEKCWCVDVFPADPNGEGTTAAIVYDWGTAVTCYDNIDPKVINGIYEIIRRENM